MRVLQERPTLCRCGRFNAFSSPSAQCTGEKSNAAQSRGTSACCQAVDRRTLLTLSGLGAATLAADRADAVQGLTAGRIPGLVADPDYDGFSIYTRPEGKSGGHGVGWSEIPRYSFRIPNDWQESPVSIADLGGTEIDLRFKNRDEGDLSIIVAPVLRFRDVGYNADVNMEFLGDPDKIIAGFTPELYGSPLTDDQVLETNVFKKDDQTYYQWYLIPHRMVTATATGNRIFLLATNSNSRQWRKGAEHVKLIADSFYVPRAKAYGTGF
eukprot:TRINITY_DN4806_c0_g1_i1.p1 TRINITY_DN4806_c0_g1~~TRINITY_DN4806_c0_g1_i1.p1  ORF type:complete len:268 (-),score=7.47 TRINITY_DN4806_c0_g1_i1:361-1164(-)